MCIHTFTYTCTHYYFCLNPKLNALCSASLPPSLLAHTHTGPQDICVVKADVLPGPCIGDIGLPLTAKVKGTNERCVSLALSLFLCVCVCLTKRTLCTHDPRDIIRVLLGLATNKDCANGGSSNASNASNTTTFVFVETTALYHSSAASGSGSGVKMLRLPAGVSVYFLWLLLCLCPVWLFLCLSFVLLPLPLALQVCLYFVYLCL